VSITLSPEVVWVEPIKSTARFQRLPTVGPAKSSLCSKTGGAQRYSFSMYSLENGILESQDAYDSQIAEADTDTSTS
jgi:hypothetical protein